MAGVGWVVLNRRTHPAFPSTVCEVVRQGGERPGCQFAYWCDGRSDTPGDDAMWALALEVSGDLLAGQIPDPTSGALFFHSAALDDVPWTLPRERTARIGTQIYYR